MDANNPYYVVNNSFEASNAISFEAQSSHAKAKNKVQSH